MWENAAEFGAMLISVHHCMSQS
eukprot:COSAG06_NODE_24024_length_675_cov_0.678819_2_plen_22_part_01